VDYVLATLFYNRKGFDDACPTHILYKHYQVEELWEGQQSYSMWPLTLDFKSLDVQVVHAKFYRVPHCEQQEQSV
jgi:hypothetical protein